MDLDEWELLPNDHHHHHSFLDFHEDGNKKVFTNQTNIFKTNYFIVESPPDEPRLIHSTAKNGPNGPKQAVPVQVQLVPVPIQLDQKIQISISPSEQTEKAAPTVTETVAEHDPDTVSQVFFKKMKENEFVDMKMDSPKSGNRGILQHTQGECLDNGKLKEISENEMDLDANLEEDGGGLNLWKWRFNGIGALCSVGLAAATICILVFGSHQRNKHHQKMRFQIYTDDKRIRKVVHHAHTFNEAISAVRGVPLNRAHITFGGYYDAL